MRATLAVVSCVLLAVLVAAAVQPGRKTRWYELEKKNYDFDQYIAEYGRHYEPNSAEYVTRKAIFDAKLKQILAHNKQPHVSYKMGVNHLTDRTDSEYRALLGYHKSLAHAARSHLESLSAPFTLPTNVELPTSVDWRLKGAVTPVKDQGGCGDCWAFSSTESMESHWFLKTGQLFDLSVEQVAMCTSNPLDCGGFGGCEGGIAELAFQSVKDNGGLVSEFNYPYYSYSGTDYVCYLNASWFQFQPAAQVSGWVKLPVNDQSALLNAVATIGPISISVDASNWGAYEEGVFDGCNMQAPDVDHVVQLVGYGTTPQGQDYWLVRNSWATTYGENGYIRIARPSTAPCGVDPVPGDGSACKPYPANVTVCGMCGILSDSSYPLMSS